MKNSAYEIIFGKSKIVKIKELNDLFEEELGKNISIIDYHKELYERFNQNIKRDEVFEI